MEPVKHGGGGGGQRGALRRAGGRPQTCARRLVIWPGFTTSILQYENSIMLCTDVSHKVLRSETVLDFMFSLFQQTEEHRFQEQVSKELVGLIVLTK